MGKYSEVFVGIDTAKKKNALAIANAGRDGETRYLGEIDTAPATVERVIKKLASKYERRYGFVMKLDQGVMGSIGRS